MAAPPRDSATVLLLRARRGGGDGVEVFMVRRHGKSAFMGGAYVFPGGTVDEDDRSSALWTRVEGHDPESAARALGEDDGGRALALYCTAVRETFEEAGVLLGDVRGPEGLPAARQRLIEGGSFAPLLDELEAHLRLDLLVPHSRWITPEIEPRRYDARFFLAWAPADQRAAHDQLETTAGEWLTPQAALSREREGAIQLPPPTMRTLEALAPFPSVEAAIEDAASRPPPIIEPLFKQIGEELVLCLPGDPEHPMEGRAFAGPTRLVLENGRWWSREAPQ